MPKSILRSLSLCILATVPLFPVDQAKAVQPNTWTLPADIGPYCFFTQFYYNLPLSDFTYHLNDRLLFSETPDGKLLDSGIRKRLLQLLRIQSAIGSLLDPVRQEKRLLTLSLARDAGTIKNLFSLLQLQLGKSSGQWQIFPPDLPENLQFHLSFGIDLSRWEKELNESQELTIACKTTEIFIPWDFSFLNQATGLNLHRKNFYEQLLRNEPLSLFLASLFRLSEAEINFISNLDPLSPSAPWQQIYSDRRFLTGFFLLSHALRVEEGRLLLPGGEHARSFWKELSGQDPYEQPFLFLQSIAQKDEGKLNQLYLFSMFLDEPRRSFFLNGYQSPKIDRMLKSMRFGFLEKIQADLIPQFSIYHPFLLAFLLEGSEGKPGFPLTIRSWLQALDPNRKENGGASSFSSAEPDFSDLMIRWQKKTGSTNAPENEILLALVAKFRDHPEKLDPALLTRLYSVYPERNVLIDYLEKIPYHRPESAAKLLDWVDKIMKCPEPDRSLFTSVSQCLLEIISYRSRHPQSTIDYDRTLDQLSTAPLQKSFFYDSIFAILEQQLHISRVGNVQKDFFDFLLSGIRNQPIQLENETYLFCQNDWRRQTIDAILLSQETTTLSDLADINQLLGRLDPAKHSDRETLEDLFSRLRELPYSEIDRGAPRYLFNRIRSYPDEKIRNWITRADQIQIPGESLMGLIREIKGDVLIYHLRDFLLTSIYGLYAKNPQLRVFLNPNLVRMHDFDTDSLHTPWKYSGLPLARHKKSYQSVFFLKGGLSRLPLGLAMAWYHQIMRNKTSSIFDIEHVQIFAANILFHIDQCWDKEAIRRTAGLIKRTSEWLEQSLTNPVEKNRLLSLIRRTICGYHYREVCRYLEAGEGLNPLYFQELATLGERLFDHDARDRDHFKDFLANPMWKGFFRVTPTTIGHFPPDLAALFQSGSMSAQLINEFLYRVAYLLDKNSLAPELLGIVLDHYLATNFRGIYAQKHHRDFHSSYFMFSIFQNGHIQKTINKMKKDGILRLNE